MLKRFIQIIAVLAFFGAIIAFIGYQWIYGINTKHIEVKEIFIESGDDFEKVVNVLKENQIIKNTSSFRRVAGWMKYSDRVRPGRYLIETDLSNRRLVSYLRSGNQKPVKVTFSTARTIHDIAGVVSQKLEGDSLTFLEVMKDTSVLEQYGLNEDSAISLFIPNTYELYWNTSPQEFLKRMNDERQRFWGDQKRSTQLAALDMTPEQVSALASIVEKESIQGEERPVIAGVYLNRIERGIPLQADPTVVFAVGDFSIRRVLNKHLKFDSPYNTYLYPGIPPGPICMPSISSIDAVLNADNHDYLFFCAKPGYNGYHSFAKTSGEHARNARLYRNWLNSEGIRG